MMQIRRSWNERAIDQAEKILACDVSAVQGTKQAARYTFFYCTALDLCSALCHRAIRAGRLIRHADIVSGWIVEDHKLAPDLG